MAGRASRAARLRRPQLGETKLWSLQRRLGLGSAVWGLGFERVQRFRAPGAFRAVWPRIQGLIQEFPTDASAA